MIVRLSCAGRPLPVSPFINRFVGNVCRAVASCLHVPGGARTLEFALEGDAVTLRVDGVDVPLGLGQGFAHVIVRDTLSGMTRSLKGIDPGAVLRVEVEGEAGGAADSRPR